MSDYRDAENARRERLARVEHELAELKAQLISLCQALASFQNDLRMLMESSYK